MFYIRSFKNPNCHFFYLHSLHESQIENHDSIHSFVGKTTRGFIFPLNLLEIIYYNWLDGFRPIISWRRCRGGFVLSLWFPFVDSCFEDPSSRKLSFWFLWIFCFWKIKKPKRILVTKYSQYQKKIEKSKIQKYTASTLSCKRGRCKPNNHNNIRNREISC